MLAAATSNSAADVLAQQLSASFKPHELLRLNWYQRHIHSINPAALQTYCNIDQAVRAHLASVVLMALQLQTSPLPSDSVLKDKRIVVVTCGAAQILVARALQGHFTHIFIDEASQSMEPETFIPISLAVPTTCVVW